MQAVPADPNVIHPMPDQPRVVLLKPLVTSPLIEVGEFCALGEGVRFIMNGANHRMDGPSTFPFPIMGGGWAEHFGLITGLPGRGDTVVGHDVWFGYRTTVMPGVRIGHGAIIASGSVVVDDVPDYGIADGNPARLIRHRFDAPDIARLLALAWRRIGQRQQSLHRWAGCPDDDGLGVLQGAPTQAQKDVEAGAVAELNSVQVEIHSAARTTKGFLQSPPPDPFPPSRPADQPFTVPRT